jgi:hypothetical protein
MGVLDRFERSVERAVNGAFAKAFRSEVQPVEIASALRREVDDRAAVVARNRTLVPNSFVVELGPGDSARLGEWEDALADELVAVVVEHAEAQRYAFVGPVAVSFTEAEDLDTGVFRVRSATVKGRIAPAPTGAVRRSGTPVLEVDGRAYPLTGAVAVVGRGHDVDVVVDDPGVSRRHCEVRLEGGAARVTDLGSTNGTLVDGQKVGTAVLREGSVITVGRTRLVYRTSADGTPG